MQDKKQEKRISIKSVLTTGKEHEACTLTGWVRTKRLSKNCGFIEINDGSSQKSLQLTVPMESEAFQILKAINTGASIEARGTLVQSLGKGQTLELQTDTITLIGDADPQSYPLQKKGHTLEFLREIAHLRPRTNTFGAMFRVRNQLSYSVHQFFQERGFIWAHTPILTASDCEGAGELFHVTTLDLKNVPKTEKNEIDYTQDFFGKPAHLTVSGQLEAEFLALSLGNVYTFGPTFRAENSNTARHLSEFWMIEPEVAFYDIHDCMDLAESFVQEVLAAVIKKCPDELKFFEEFYKNTNLAALEEISQNKFVRITYTEAIEILKKSSKAFEYPVKWGIDLQTEHERFLTDEVFKKPTFVTHYPTGCKAFYMKLDEDEKTVSAYDLLVPGVGELIGGSQREDRVDVLLRRMADLKIPTQDLQWYLDLRRFGSVPHGGFGLGFERLIMYVTGMKNIRDVTLCPRAPGLISF